MRKIKLGILGSTNGTDLQAIIDAINEDELNASVEIVISNVNEAYILARAENYGIPNYFISHRNKERVEFDNEISDLLKEYKIDLILLIGFMRILSSEFCSEWNGKILNVHPSLLPKYAGGMDKDVHQEVLNSGDKETGCTIHYVTQELDGGPILIQKRCLISNQDTPESLKEKVQKLEAIALIEAITIIQNNLNE